MTKVPFIFVLDLDGTVIGDCCYQVILHEVEHLLKTQKQKITNKQMLSNCYKGDVKLLRPYFLYFVQKMKKYNPECQFYIYTASETSWANNEISMIEKTNNIKLNRPIFTRKDCIVDSDGMYKKSITKILPQIQKNNKDFTIGPKNLLIIDNNNVFIDFLSNFILCPSYDYIHFCDVWKKLKNEHLRNEVIDKYTHKLIISNKICQFNDDFEDDKKNELKHKWYFKKYKRLNKHNSVYAKDKFWKTLADAIVSKQILEFNKNTLKSICF